MASSIGCVLALLTIVLSCLGGATAQIVILQKSGITPSRRFCTDTSRGAQSSGTADAVQSPTKHDAWRSIPKPLQPPPSDLKQTAILIDRAQYFDVSSVSGVPLDQPQPPREGGSSGSFVREDEFPFFPNEAIVVGSFEDYQVYLTPSRLSIFTDLKLSVEQVFEPGPIGISQGQTIDLLIGGGTVLLPDGRTISDHAYDPTGNYSLQPGHRYVFFLEYRSHGEFFRDHKDWELVNGISVPNRLDEAIRAREGRARYSGLGEDAFIEALRKAILQYNQEK
jgi:hypothetical protein